MPMKLPSLILLVALAACAPHDTAPRPDSIAPPTVMPLYHSASYAAIFDSAPPTPQPYYAYDAYNVTIAGDSLKVVLVWTQPTDGLGVADSTVDIFHVTKAIRFYNDTALRNANTRVRRRYATSLSDSFKLARPSLGDSVLFSGDSIFQCRKGQCSVPGSWAFKYIRTATPPPMTVIKIVHDSF
jgi:hypothetical protein